MTRRRAILAEAEAAPDLEGAVQKYVARFGQGPPVWGFLHRKADLIREILSAVKRGEPLPPDVIE
jgi:hypothetical protein